MIPRTVRLRSGAAVLLRSATPDDAQARIQMLRDVFADSPWLLSTPDEVKPLPEMVAHIQRAAAHPAALAMHAIELDADGNEGKTVGSLGLHTGTHRKADHHVDLGMGLLTPFRGLGLGRAMLEAALDYAAGVPGLEIVYLGVIPENATAAALYRSVGFTEEGRQRGFLKLPGGSRHDHVLMALFVKPGLAPPGYCCWPRSAADGR